MSKFKIGDRVIYVSYEKGNKEDPMIFTIGEEYTINNIGNHAEVLWFEEVKESGAFFNQVSRGIRDTKIARKVYKNRIVAEKNGYIFLKNEE